MFSHLFLFCFFLLVWILDLKIFFFLNSIFFTIFKFFVSILTLFKFIPFKSLVKKKKKESAWINRNKKIRSEPTIKRGLYRKIKKNNESGYELNKSEDIQYTLPSTELLKLTKIKLRGDKETDKKNSLFAERLEKILAEYGVEGKVVNYMYGPVVTLYEFLPAAGIKTSKVVGLSDDIARAMSSLSTRISSQPGKTSIGIEIPNLKREDVLLGDLVNEQNFLQNDGLTLALGKNISGEKKFTDLEKMPHLLIAGTTGSGKSVGINSMIVSLLLKFTPSECKLILIDPKMLELSIYEDIPHLLTPVVTNPNKAVLL